MSNLTQEIKPISYIKAHTAEIIKQVEVSRAPVIITQNGEAKAVIIDVESYQKTLNSLNLLKLISIGDNDIKTGRTKSHEEVINHFNKKFHKK